MAQIAIRLNTLTEVKEFNAAAAQIPGDVDLRSGRYCVDAKSIMGIFSLNLGRDLTVESNAVSEDELRKRFAVYLVK
ncbi:HPr family phosphocarrier protein [uncultured Gemmiger sp.]|mgnify:FL=1|jgi:phosphocarrier protein HPr|uniref:HPr family phosphocarrier protein n=1 Tax=uncultured Gemmiger sp. TaxID=1623490 RepID=UPI0025D5046E|nr:HPr family phosphocarrier protein [uncultured Gemmiger sp.]